MNARDELAVIIWEDAVADRVKDGTRASLVPVVRAKCEAMADKILAAGYRKIFDGDCGLSGVEDPTDREASEVWMRWANLVSGEDSDGIAAMKQTLTEFGYRKPRTITTVEELDALGHAAVVRDAEEYVLERWGRPEDDMWATPMNGAWIRSAEVTLPATVLYEGGQS